METTYENELTWLASAPERQVVARAYENASRMGWPGKSGGNDRAVMLALLSIAWQFSSYVVHASIRDIGEHAAINSTATLKGVTDRLHSNGLVIKRGSGSRTKGSIYVMNAFIDNMQYPNINHISTTPSKKCDLCSSIADETWMIADVWSPKNLGKIAALYYSLSAETWRSNIELGKALGKDPRTIRNWGMRLAEKGLANSETEENKRWKLGLRLLEDVALELGTEKQAIRRQEFHDREREDHREYLDGQRKKILSGEPG